ncbi:hypothetical protein U2G54_004280 [Vibrio fluvialis]|nr:hypothetical protein [Vibrio fluvialis]
MKKLTIAVSALVLFGCANSDERITKKTADYFNVPASEVNLKHAEKNALDTYWRVEINNEEYACNADDMLRDLKCIPMSATHN